MPAERVSMRQIREVLRLRFASELPQRGIAKSLRLSQGTVSGYLSRARAAGVSWPLPEDLDDVQLEALLFPPSPAIAADQRLRPASREFESFDSSTAQDRDRTLELTCRLNPSHA